MKSQISLGTVFGIKIGLHYSWFLIALLIVLSLSRDFGASHPQWDSNLVLALAIATALLFFVSLLLHELSHSLVAKARGIPVREITLFALGGISQIEGEAGSAKTEFWMALVGPLTSAFIGLACTGVVAIAGGAGQNPLMAVLSWLGYINFGLAAFNMVPGYPLDGGRILRAIVWWKTGDADRATRTAAKVGQAVGGALITMGVIQYFGGGGLGGLWIAFIGWFLLQAAGTSYMEVSLRRSLQGVRVSDVMSRDCPTVDARRSVQDFVDHDLLRTGRRCFVVVENGSIAGLVTSHEIRQTDRSQWPHMALADVMRPLSSLHTVAPEEGLASALEVMAREDFNQLPVISNGRLEGVLSRAEVLSYLQTRAELQA